MLDYELLDYGAGRRLERFGTLVLDRPCPAAVGAIASDPARWKAADVRFVAENIPNGANKTDKNSAFTERGFWEPLTERGRSLFFEPVENSPPMDNALRPKIWSIQNANPDFALELVGSPFGHLGVFPEQSANWTRIFQLCRDGEKKLGRPLRVLNLFAYTGASTLAAALGRAETVHLDAARNSVERARRNAELSGAAGKIRFIADDAVKFVRRQMKRGNFYDGVILDPPTYGHGAHGEVWRLARDLPGHLSDLFSILADDFPFVLLSCHTTGFEAAALTDLLKNAAAGRFGKLTRFSFNSGSMRPCSKQRKSFFAGDFALIRCIEN